MVNLKTRFLSKEQALEERKGGANTYPPKMASFGSSSRMIYNLIKNTKGFLFEKKLPTTIGGIANLDGFMEEDSGQIYTIYDQTCNECLSVNFKALFEVIVDYLQSVKNTGKNKNKTDIVNAFDFKLCDQRNMNI